MSTCASVIGVVFALLAALFWAGSALVNIPVIGSAYGTIANLEPFYAALKRVARLNAAAATCAFISALAQAIAVYTAWRRPPVGLSRARTRVPLQRASRPDRPPPDTVSWNYSAVLVFPQRSMLFDAGNRSDNTGRVQAVRRGVHAGEKPRPSAGGPGGAAPDGAALARTGAPGRA